MIHQIARVIRRLFIRKTTVYVNVNTFVETITPHCPSFRKHIATQLIPFLNRIGKYYGVNTVIHAYGELDQYRGMKYKEGENKLDCTINLTHTPSLTRQGKTAVDALIWVKMRESLKQSDRVAVITEQGLYYPILDSLKRLGIEVELLPFSSVSPKLSVSVNRIVDTRELLSSLITDPLQQAQRLLQQQLVTTTKPLPLASAAHLLRLYQINNWMGHGSFKAFVKALNIPNLELLPDNAGTLTLSSH